MSRVAFYIDGFNVYHVIDRYEPKCKWLDLRQMGASVIPHSDTISKVTHMFDDAMNDVYDKAILISGDTDFVPIITTIKQRFPEKQLGVMLPIGAQAKSLKGAADFSIKMKRKHLVSHQLPESIENQHGIITKPPEWA